MAKLVEQIKKNYQSVRNIEWRLKEPNGMLLESIRNRFDLSEMIVHLLATRGIDLEEVDNYLNPTIKSYLPNPSKLRDMDKAAEFLVNAIVNKKKIAIFGDYDVDGATSTALLYKFFSNFKLEIGIYIPDRISEGYGPNNNAFSLLKEQGYEIVITVDCGVSAFEQIKFAKDIGLEIIIVDHHLPSSYELPEAVAIVNPNRLDDESNCNHLAAVGVSFLLTVAIRSYLLEKNLIDKDLIPNLLELLDLVALGTVCDMVPLVGVNRAFVAQGLKVISQKKNKGLAALINIAAIKEELSVYHLGFLLGPRINAGGRVGKSHYGSQLLTATCSEEAFELSRELDLYNQERKAIEASVLEEALIQAELKSQKNSVLVISGEGWHPGVIGIVAGRIKEIYNKPVAVISFNEGIGKASCRSVRCFDFGGTIMKAKEGDLLIIGGGHKMAAGFTIKAEYLEEFERFLNISYSEQILDYEDHGVHYFDGYLSCGGINLDLLHNISLLAPFGTASLEPRFMIKDCSLVNIRVAKDKHILATIGGIRNGDTNMVRATSFNSVGTVLGESLLNARGKSFHLIGTITQNKWQDREFAELQIIDLIHS